jgi:hypothetical protein
MAEPVEVGSHLKGEADTYGRGAIQNRKPISQSYPYRDRSMAKMGPRTFIARMGFKTPLLGGEPIVDSYTCERRFD